MAPTRRIPLSPALLAATGAGILLHGVPGLAQPVPAVGAALGIGRTTRGGGGVALTFDDGPHAQGTPAVLDALRDHGATATFFLVGEQVARAPALAAEIVAAGHAVGLHCDRHRNLLRLAPGQVSADLERARERIVGATGVDPDLHRAPYGIYTGEALAIVRRRGLRPLLWTHWGRDWRAKATADSIASEATSALRPGSVVLLHDADDYSAPGSWRRTVAALPRILERVAEAGLPHEPV